MENSTNTRRIRRNREYWQQQIEAWQRSGLTQAEYGRRNDINPTYLSQWKSRLSRANEKMPFVEIQTASVVSDRQPIIDIRLEENLEFRISVNLSSDRIAKLFGWKGNSHVAGEV